LYYNELQNPTSRKTEGKMTAKTAGGSFTQKMLQAHARGPVRPCDGFLFAFKVI
jgi:hypothetical protein